MVLSRKLVVTASLVAALSCGGVAAALAGTQVGSSILGVRAADAAEAPAAASSAQDGAKAASAAAAGSAKADKPASTIGSVGITASADTRTVTDSDGNEVVIPKEVTKVAPTIGAFAQITEILTNGNGKIVAAAAKNISDDFRATLPDYDKTNPQNLDASNIENLIAAGCQVVYGPSSAFSDEQKQQLQQAGIAFVSVSKMSTVDQLCDATLTIGQILGDTEYQRAQDFVSYWKAGIQTSQDRLKDVADADKPGCLELDYTGGQYATVNSTDIFSEYLKAAGGINLAADYTAGKNGTALEVSAEQIVAWNPSVIFARQQEAADQIMADPALANVDAVKNGKVYTVPTGLYMWSVRSGEGAMTTPWLDTILWPDQFSDIDMSQVVTDFYKTWYNADVTPEKVEEILTGQTNQAR